MKKLTFFTVALAAIALAGCSKDENPGAKLPAGRATEVTLTVGTPDDTKAPTENSTEKESAVKTLEFYVFNADKTPDTEVGKSGTTPGNGYIKFDSPTSAKKLIVGSGTGKRFVALVNMNIGPLTSGQTYDDLKAKLSTGEFLADKTSRNHNSRNEDLTTGFEMSGEVMADIIEEKVDNKVFIRVDRLSSKIKAPTFFSDASAGTPAGVTLSDNQIEKLWGENSGITNARLSFEFIGYALINGISRSDAFFIGNADGNDMKKDQEGFPVWDTWATKGAYRNSEFNDPTGEYTNTYSGYGTTDWFLSGTEASNSHRVYLYENKPGTITTPEGQTGFDPDNVVAFIIKGKLIVDGNDSHADNKIRYWRVDLVKKDAYHILRNSVYEVNIKTITSIGENTPKDAEKKPGIVPGPGESAADVDITVNPWRLNKCESEM